MTKDRASLGATNWARSLNYSARQIVSASSVEEVAELVAGTSRVHALGTRHSFSDVADASGVLVELGRLPVDLDVDEAMSTASLSSAARYGSVAPDIDSAGFALHNLGSLPHISVGGAVATGTHGSGTTLGSLSTAVRAFDVIGADGETRTFRRGMRAFEGAVMHLGLLGVVTRVTLDLQPSYRMRQDAYGPMAWATYLENLSAVHSAAYSVSAFTNFNGAVGEILSKSRIPEEAHDIEVADELFGAARLAGAPKGPDHTDRDGSVGAWWDRLPHFPISGTPSVGAELQSEHFVSLCQAAAALEAVREYAARIQPILHVCELRTMAGDDLWLSPTQGEDVLCIAFTWKQFPVAVAEVLADIEKSLTQFDARPHWGKLSSLKKDAIAECYPKLPAFRRLAAEFDPDR